MYRTVHSAHFMAICVWVCLCFCLMQMGAMLHHIILIDEMFCGVCVCEWVRDATCVAFVECQNFSTYAIQLTNTNRICVKLCQILTENTVWFVKRYLIFVICSIWPNAFVIPSNRFTHRTRQTIFNFILIILIDETTNHQISR